MIFYRSKLSTEHLLIVFKEISYSCKKAKRNMVTGYMGWSICCCKNARISACCVWWQNVDGKGSDVLHCCCGKSSLKRSELPRDVGGIFTSFTSAEWGSTVYAMSPSGETAGCWGASGPQPPFGAALWDLFTCSQSRFPSGRWDLPANGCWWSR